MMSFHFLTWVWPHFSKRGGLTQPNPTQVNWAELNSTVSVPKKQHTENEKIKKKTSQKSSRFQAAVDSLHPAALCSFVRAPLRCICVLQTHIPYPSCHTPSKPYPNAYRSSGSDRGRYQRVYQMRDSFKYPIHIEWDGYYNSVKTEAGISVPTRHTSYIFLLNLSSRVDITKFVYIKTEISDSI